MTVWVFFLPKLQLEWSFLDMGLLSSVHSYRPRYSSLTHKGYFLWVNIDFIYVIAGFFLFSREKSFWKSIQITQSSF